MIDNNSSEEVESTSFTGVEVSQGFENKDKAILLGIIPRHLELESIHYISNQEIEKLPKSVVSIRGRIYLLQY
jgi:hypothetical protein